MIIRTVSNMYTIIINKPLLLLWLIIIKMIMIRNRQRKNRKKIIRLLIKSRVNNQVKDIDTYRKWIKRIFNLTRTIIEKSGIIQENKMKIRLKIKMRYNISIGYNSNWNRLLINIKFNRLATLYRRIENRCWLMA